MAFRIEDAHQCAITREETDMRLIGVDRILAVFVGVALGRFVEPEESSDDNHCRNEAESEDDTEGDYISLVHCGGGSVYICAIIAIAS